MRVLRALAAASARSGLCRRSSCSSSLAAQLAWATGGPVTRGVVVVALINLVLVVGLYIFVGNSGVFSFGSIGLAAVGAYTAGLLVIPVELQDDPAARAAGVHRGDELRHRWRDADGRPRRGASSRPRSPFR